STGNSGASISVTPSSTTTYTVTVSNIAGCTASDDVTVTVNALPVADAGTDFAICDGGSGTVDASASTGTPTLTYNWDNGLGAGVSHTIMPASTTTYTVTVTDGNNCTSTDDVIVTINSLPSAYAGVDQTICEGNTATLTATGGTSYAWSSGDITATASVNPVVTTNYTVTVSDVNGCSDTDDVTVNVNTLPLLSVSSTNAACGMTDGSATVNATGGSGTYTYQWDAAAAAQTTATAINLGAGTYYVTVDDGLCPVSTSATVIEDGVPVVSVVASSDTICEGGSVEIIASGADTYAWTPATGLNTTTGNTVIASPTATITYSVEGTSGACTNSTTVTIEVIPLPVAGFTYVDNMLEVTFTNTSQNAVTYFWNFGDGATTNMPNPVYTYGADGTYTVMLVATNECTSDTAYQTITVIGNSDIDPLAVEGRINLFPNPNNGVFVLEFSSAEIAEFTVTVRNITGQVIYSRNCQKPKTDIQQTINLGQIAKGTYELQVKQGDNVYNSRFVVGDARMKKPVKNDDIDTTQK
ncbi:MAG: PKD domain-containing protein, partial [Bacteroidota bacterium]